VLGTLFGIFMGPYFAGVFDPRSWGSNPDEFTLEVMRIVLTIGLFAIGVELPKSYMAYHAKSLLTLVVPTMAIGWAIVAGVYSLLARCVFTNSLFFKVFSVSYFLNCILYPAWLFLPA
jgi:NhaP-type Na+/H+ or K+/H+ antiporter